MKQGNKIIDRILSIDQLNAQVNRWKLLGKTISFTNGVFDILHEGHVKVLTQAASFADILIVGLNSDASVKRLKGEERPVNNQDSRALLLASLLMVDAVVIFEEDTPLNLINTIIPDVLVKGGDYNIDTIVGAKEVMQYNGKVEVIPLEKGFSTTGIIEKLKNL
ncbi:MAG: D-glycero-beta-D-manno-heptose 1-phosphate adenylyltransferase [Ginsengibacter sp.]